MSAVKHFDFTWSAVEGADTYRILWSHDGGADYVQVGPDIVETSASLTVGLHRQLGSRYVLQACNDSGCDDSMPIEVIGSMVDAIGYFKASNPSEDDYLGDALAISSDGNTLVVGAHAEDSAATGVDGDAHDDSMPSAGAVYVFVRRDDQWMQQAYLKASNTNDFDQFGLAVALSADGDTLAVGANYEDSAATGIDGDQSDDTRANAGAVYVFERTGDAWSQQAYVKASNTDGLDEFGCSVALSASGDTLVVGARFEDRASTGVDGDQYDDGLADSGSVYVFGRVDGQWSQDAYIKASNPDIGDEFGSSVAVSGDGETLAVGAIQERSSATGVDGDQSDNSTPFAGATYVFHEANGLWSQQAYVKAAADAGALFGNDLALSASGDTLAVSARHDNSGAKGINGDPTDTSETKSGAAYVFERSAGSWVQTTYVKASNTDALDRFGSSLALSPDGETLAVSAPSEAGGAVGVGGDQADTSVSDSGAAYVFVRSAETWVQQAYVKASNTEHADGFGSQVVLSGDGDTLAVSARAEGSAAVGVDGDQSDDGADNSGAVYLY